MNKILNKMLNKNYNRELVEDYVSFCINNSLEKHIPFKTENHHILPKSIFVEFEDLKAHKWNSALLSLEHHYEAHYKLGLISDELSLGWYYMNNKTKDVPLTEEHKNNYAKLRKAAIKIVSAKNRGKNRTPKQKKKLVEASKLKNWEDIGNKISETKKAKYEIYNSKDELIHKCTGNLRKYLKDNFLPSVFMISYKKEGLPIYKTKASINASKAEDVKKFKGWYCVKNGLKKENHVFNNSVGAKSFKYTILDENNIEIYKVEYGLAKFCKDNNLPFQQLRVSLKTGKPLYSEDYPNNIKSRIVNSKHYKKYYGWKIIK